MSEKLKTLAVVGAGQMGAGIAHVFAASGFDTMLFDAKAGAAEKAKGDIEKRLGKLVEKGTITAEDQKQTLSRLKLSGSLTEFSKSDLVVEAIVENFDIKKSLFTELDSICPAHTVFASNTSSIPITKMAAVTKRPEKFIGMHFMNPVPVMKLVEIIRGLQTDDATYQTVVKLTESIKKTPVTAKMDYPGFVVNRILMPLINEAFFALMEGLASAEEIDTAMKLGTNHPMGPLELADFVGLDTCLSICQILHRELGDDKYRPCPLMIKYVEAGWYGRKVGRGVFKY